jgi:hypothetical protein
MERHRVPAEYAADATSCDSPHCEDTQPSFSSDDIEANTTYPPLGAPESMTTQVLSVTPMVGSKADHYHQRRKCYWIVGIICIIAAGILGWALGVTNWNYQENDGPNHSKDQYFVISTTASDDDNNNNLEACWKVDATTSTVMLVAAKTLFDNDENNKNSTTEDECALWNYQGSSGALELYVPSGAADDEAHASGQCLATTSSTTAFNNSSEIVEEVLLSDCDNITDNHLFMRWYLDIKEGHVMLDDNDSVPKNLCIGYNSTAALPSTLTLMECDDDDDDSIDNETSTSFDLTDYYRAKKVQQELFEQQKAEENPIAGKWNP